MLPAAAGRQALPPPRPAAPRPQDVAMTTALEAGGQGSEGQTADEVPATVAQRAEDSIIVGTAEARRGRGGLPWPWEGPGQGRGRGRGLGLGALGPVGCSLRGSGSGGLRGRGSAQPAPECTFLAPSPPPPPTTLARVKPWGPLARPCPRPLAPCHRPALAHATPRRSAAAGGRPPRRRAALHRAPAWLRPQQAAPPRRAPAAAARSGCCPHCCGCCLPVPRCCCECAQACLCWQPASCGASLLLVAWPLARSSWLPTLRSVCQAQVCLRCGPSALLLAVGCCTRVPSKAWTRNSTTPSLCPEAAGGMLAMSRPRPAPVTPLLALPCMRPPPAGRPPLPLVLLLLTRDCACMRACTCSAACNLCAWVTQSGRHRTVDAGASGNAICTSP